MAYQIHESTFYSIIVKNNLYYYNLPIGTFLRTKSSIILTAELEGKVIKYAGIISCLLTAPKENVVEVLFQFTTQNNTHTINGNVYNLEIFLPANAYKLTSLFSPTALSLKDLKPMSITEVCTILEYFKIMDLYRIKNFKQEYMTTVIEEGFIYKNKNLSGMPCVVLEPFIEVPAGTEAYAFVEFQEDVDGSSNDGKNTKKNCLFLPKSKIKNIRGTNG